MIITCTLLGIADLGWVAHTLIWGSDWRLPTSVLVWIVVVGVISYLVMEATE